MNKQILQPLKGFRDFTPKEALARAWLKNKLIEIFESWGYDPIETPTLEALEVFKDQIGEDEKLFYKFNDPGGRGVALRYDQSVPASRFVGRFLQDLPLPFKRYQIQPAFRAEKPQKGRYRELLQCDADIFGVESPYADAEVIALSLDIYRRLGFKQAKLLVNDRELLTDIPYKAIVVIDKLKKIGKEKVIKEMEKKGIEKKYAKQYLGAIARLKPNATIKIIFDYLDRCGFDKSWYEFDPTIARSFSYSTGPIWEIEIPEFAAGSVLGGERFDKLVFNLAGKKVPATGFGLGFDRTLEAAMQFNLIPIIKTKTMALVTVFNETLLEKSIKLSSNLRSSGINAEVYTEPNAKLDKQLKYADKKGIPFVVILGPDEVGKDQAVLKDMKKGAQQTLSVEDLVKRLS